MSEADDRKAIARRTSELLAAVNGSNVDGVMAVWDDDGVMMPPGSPAVRGRAALDAYFRRLFAGGRFEFVFTSSEIDVNGDIALERLAYTATAWPAGGAAAQSSGKGLHVYRRGPDGTSKLTHDIWNSDSQ